MTKPMKAVAPALACLLGLAACGGGGGGGGAGGGPAIAPSVASLSAAIEAYTPAPDEDVFAVSRRSDDGIVYTIGFQNAMPVISASSTSSDSGTPRALQHEHLGGNVWRFTDTYTSGGTPYEGTVLFFYDSGAVSAGGQHHWGVWLRLQTETGIWDEANTFHVQTGGRAAFSPPNLRAARGAATYTGSASGLYTKDKTSTGWFSARSTLTVNYGGNVVESIKKYTMTGTIDTFVLSGGEQQDWSVELTGTPTTWIGNRAPTSTHFTGTTDGGDSTSGAFTTKFYGASFTEQPSLVTGEFKAHFDDGAVIGGFHATRD